MVELVITIGLLALTVPMISPPIMTLSTTLISQHKTIRSMAKQHELLHFIKNDINKATHIDAISPKHLTFKNIDNDIITYRYEDGRLKRRKQRFFTLNPTFDIHNFSLHQETDHHLQFRFTFYHRPLILDIHLSNLKNNDYDPSQITND